MFISRRAQDLYDIHRKDELANKVARMEEQINMLRETNRGLLERLEKECAALDEAKDEIQHLNYHLGQRSLT